MYAESLESGPESLQRQHMSNPPGHTHCAPERAFAEFFRAVPRRNSIELAQDCLLDFRKNAFCELFVLKLSRQRHFSRRRKVPILCAHCRAKKMSAFGYFIYLS